MRSPECTGVSAASPAVEPNATIPERIFSLLREAIVEGEIPSGSKISEPELARAYGISRGPLREAIGRLEACGLVVRRPNVGARVVTLSSKQLLEIFHVREALEGMAARLAAQNMTAAEISDLRRLLMQHGEQIDRDSDHAYFQREGDLDFHYRIVQGSHNRRMVEHGHIVDAIERRDPEMAELMMRSHIRASRENVERLLQEQSIQG